MTGMQRDLFLSWTNDIEFALAQITNNMMPAVNSLDPVSIHCSDELAKALRHAQTAQQLLNGTLSAEQYMNSPDDLTIVIP